MCDVFARTRLTESEKLELLDDEHLAMSSDLNEVNEAVHGVVDDVVVQFNNDDLHRREATFEGFAQADASTVNPESIEAIKNLLQNQSVGDEVRVCGMHNCRPPPHAPSAPVHTLTPHREFVLDPLNPRDESAHMVGVLPGARAACDTGVVHQG